jgi:hypothetical protein
MCQQLLINELTINISVYYVYYKAIKRVMFTDRFRSVTINAHH